ncbi:conserved hypothetical protein [Chthoniobacter flavus Ellin428]|uniref:DUF5666 domain-containing protein n=1 Tax=Chthoniobacter flavus Ellin428 TaxID=497964 RepID=B4D6J1_9BACT|nr:hypothetical protein [Chthoniobacter flavus]EDY17792.1 conserved hypothetical protein [Chthoniobacter flavus Ellin428]TCO88405.1 hypothetical protein EV701_1177 [Chthoniobacter flavus]
MNKTSLLAIVSALTLSAAAFAADANTYQVTGPILELTDTKIVVQKGKDKWELARNADTKVTGELKVGAKVIIQYSMTAQTVEVKEDKKAAKAADKATPAAKPAK